MASGAGIYAIPAEDYHADPAPVPSLSASIAHKLVNETPLHAWWAHPRLNPAYVPEEKPHFDLGTVAHELLLEGTEDRVFVVEAGSWRSKDAQEQRDQARTAGRIPLLEKDFERVREMVFAVRAQLEARDDDLPLLTDGKPEQTLVWEERGVTCRALVDWLREDLRAVDDLKTTARSANPARWSRRAMFENGHDIQAAFYLRGVRALTGQSPRFRFVIAENTPPYALSVVDAGAVLEFGDAKVDRALDLWRECLASDRWPGYPQGTYYAEVPAWEEGRWMEADAERLNA